MATSDRKNKDNLIEVSLDDYIKYLPICSGVTPFVSLALSVFSVCKLSKDCIAHYPVLSDTADYYPAATIFGFGLTLSGLFIALQQIVARTMLLTVLQRRVNEGRVATPDALKTKKITTVANVAACLITSLGLLGTTPMKVSDDWHVFFTQLYFAATTVHVLLITWALARAPMLPGEKGRRSLNWKIFTCIGWVVNALIFLLYHERIVWIEVTPIPQLTYATLECSLVLWQILWISSWYLEFKEFSYILTHKEPITPHGKGELSNGQDFPPALDLMKAQF